MGLSDLEGFFESFRGVGVSPLLVSDYDGTLVPFRRERDEAVPSRETRDLVRRIGEAGGEFILLTGREASEAASLLGVPAEIWGCHGWQRRSPGGETITMPLSGAEEDALRLLPDLFRSFPSDAVERKPVSIALHWRERPDVLEQYGKLEKSIIERASSAGLEKLPFDQGVEFRLPSCTKGEAMKRILAARSFRDPVCYLGDDVTDEDAFRALDGRGVGVLVSALPAASAAVVRIRPEEVPEFLRKWIAALEAERRESP
ncbi:trehalose-phosphatase [Aminivibrio sp.]|jgi:trehalose-phosphatase|uniref:trehalose-phosphatase n=1 Tax=Aminivibrio sp. TaxID=1872489 RepID=UPI001A524C0A|nr:trehalose-phosphatase [Aminivibrio sp.]MBL3539095.1 trehalose-phosphatase [Aminivibrio sp.]MDK2959755.1 trehalose 6-phosphate phosphatase [Synergistaceae bacterium]